MKASGVSEADIHRRLAQKLQVGALILPPEVPDVNRSEFGAGSQFGMSAVTERFEEDHDSEG